MILGEGGNADSGLWPNIGTKPGKFIDFLQVFAAWTDSPAQVGAGNLTRGRDFNICLNYAAGRV
jgi:hypothetical protein